MSKTIRLLTVCMSFILLQACSLLGGQMMKETDLVYGTSRLKLSMDYPFAEEMFSPLRSVSQTIIKEGLGTSSPSYTVYDIVELRKESFDLEDRVFLIADKQVFRMPIDNMESFRLKEPRPANGVKGQDSIKVRSQGVFNVDYFKQTRFVYHWSDSVVAAVYNAQDVYIRYYAGPDMVTLHVDKYKLKKIKTMIEQSN